MIHELTYSFFSIIIKESKGGDIVQERIQFLRKKHLKLSQAAFGDKLGVSRDVINNIENGRVPAKDWFVKAICSICNISEEWLRTGNSEMFVQTDSSILANLAEHYSLSPKMQVIISRFLKLDQEQRDVIMGYVDGIVDDFNNIEQRTERERLHDQLDMELDAEQKGLSVSQDTDLTIKKA